jgi:hypothetical protein
MATSLTGQRSIRDPDKFPTGQLFLLVSIFYLLRTRHQLRETIPPETDL